MKVWELEEGKEYTSNLCDDGTIYKITNGALYYKHRKINYGDYLESGMEYNIIKSVHFTEYIPPTDWSKVEVDTKVLVRDWDNSEWIHRHFAIYKNGRIHTWNNGRTSFTIRDKDDYVPYNQAKLYTE